MASKKRRRDSLLGTASLVAAEALEEICLLSAAPWQADISYEAWRSSTFNVDSLTQLGFSTDTREVTSATGGVSANSAKAGDLIGSGVVEQTFGYTGTGYTIAVLDTGIDYTHPDLASSYIGGWDFVDDDADPMDLNGHGTHVSGIITSDSATYGGIAPDVNIIGLRVLNAGGSGSFGDVEDALQWVVDHQAQYNIVAVNMSLGAGNFSFNPYYFMEDELTALKDQGVFIAASSGNSFYSVNSSKGLGYPAISSNTVSVGAVWSDDFGSVSWGDGGRDYSTDADRITSFTQRSAALDILAPGAFLQSTYLGHTYASMAGTSMAAPVAAAAAALIHQALDAAGQGTLANQDYILDLMKSTGVTVVDGDDENDNVTNTGLSFKRIDLMAAISSISAAPPSQFDQAAAEAFVEALYQDILNRSADSTGLATWTSMLASGSSRSEIADILWNSAEHRSLQVTEYFSTFLNRTPGSLELSLWISGIQAGVGESLAMRVFASSPEFSQLHASDGDFIDALYTKVLGRTADASGHQYWVNALSGDVSRFDVVQTFFNSTERLVNDIDAAYQHNLNRQADAAGRQFWLNVLRSNSATLQSMSTSMLGSDEYFAAAQSAGGASSSQGGIVASSLATPGNSTPDLAGLWLSPEQAEAVFSASRADGNLMRSPAGSSANDDLILAASAASPLQLADRFYSVATEDEPWDELHEDDVLSRYSAQESQGAVDDIYSFEDLSDLDDDGYVD